jgi:hypothetical protein
MRKMDFKLLTKEEILKLSEEELYTYLNGVKAYEIELKTKLAEKEEFFNNLMNKDIITDKSAMSERNKDLIVDLKDML